MGRRKIEIKAIKDDRNRSVTFLKRKGGLFKKAHELSVLCSVDVAVIIFGHNKKLYEFSSGDIRETLGRYQYYGQPHEHKGPEDFMTKREADDDDDDDSGAEDAQNNTNNNNNDDNSNNNSSSSSSSNSSSNNNNNNNNMNNNNMNNNNDNNNMIPPPQFQGQPGFQHINHAPSASPPISNGVPFGPRHGTPQPQGVSRPSSRNHVRRVSSNLVPQQHPHATPPPPPQNGFAYMPNPSIYNPNANPNLNQQPPRPGQFPQFGPPPPQIPQHQPPQLHPHQPIPQNHQHHPHQLPPHGLPHQPPQHGLPPQAPQHPMSHPPPQHGLLPPPQHGLPQPHQPPMPQQPSQHGLPQPPHQQMPQVTQAYMPDQGRHSMPPVFPPEQPQQRPMSLPEPSPPHQMPAPTKSEGSQSPPQPTSQASKSRSIFTPIDDRGSVLARHFGVGPPMCESPRSDQPPKSEFSQENSNGQSVSGPSAAPPPPARAVTEPQRPPSMPSISDIPPPPRANSTQLNAKRPRLKVQIPSENSDGGSATAESSPRESVTNKTATPARVNPDMNHSGVVLPPPSPSASALLSAGAQGPPNPFARPPPPGTASQNGTAYSNNNNIETPISALPSRFVSDALLPSPSSFFPEWGFSRSGPDSNMLPSPLTFPTPSVQTGPGFPPREDELDKKRKSPDGAATDGPTKRLKT